MPEATQLNALSPPPPLVRVESLTKSYATGRGEIVLFRELSFSVARGEMLAIVGASGAGKSTLLHLLAAMDAPTSGDVVIDGTSLAMLRPQQQAEFRNRTIGYVWQAHYLLPEFTAEENVAMPLLARGESQTEARTKARRWLREVGLADRTLHRAGELSGGEQQRVSLARALVTEPRLLLADEPTGNLDAATGDSIFDLLKRLHASHDVSTVMVTHNMAIASRCDRTLVLSAGQVLSSGRSE
jgi:lipoprotein-releasing system ATP-binding protein